MFLALHSAGKIKWEGFSTGERVTTQQNSINQAITVSTHRFWLR